MRGKFQKRQKKNVEREEKSWKGMLAQKLKEERFSENENHRFCKLL